MSSPPSRWGQSWSSLTHHGSLELGPFLHRHRHGCPQFVEHDAGVHDLPLEVCAGGKHGSELPHRSPRGFCPGASGVRAPRRPPGRSPRTGTRKPQRTQVTVSCAPGSGRMEPQSGQKSKSDWNLEPERARSMTHGVRSDGEQRLRGSDRAAAGRARLPPPAVLRVGTRKPRAVLQSRRERRPCAGRARASAAPARHWP